MPERTCPKCSGVMRSGFPVEVGGNHGMFVTYWSDDLPREITGFFGSLMGQPFTAARLPTAVLMGLCCEQCGFVELYRVAQDQLRAFLAADEPPVATK